MKYPIGIQSFETLRKDGFVYVDKTDLIYKLVQGHVYFLSRPRRFGKSLLVSTLKAYFEGRKDLFEGLKIMDLEQEWATYPVIHFDFNGVMVTASHGLSNYLTSIVESTETAYGVKPAVVSDIAQRFRHLIESLHRLTGRRVVVLIDEYDKPLLDLMETGRDGDVQQMDDNRTLLKVFFSVFKAADDHLRFVLLTGITKFSQVSMFSGFNQPDDISLDSRYDTLLGITEEELFTVFAEPIRELANTMSTTVEEAGQMLKSQYDGYHFSERFVDIYNPFSIINCFAKQFIDSYWFASGTPSYLIRLAGQTQEDIMQYTGRYYQKQMFVDYKADRALPLPMLFQGGYLTIKSYNRLLRAYKLDFPNNEVRQGFVTILANNYLQPKDEASSWLADVVAAFSDGNLEQVRRLFTSFLAETPYSMRPKKDQKDRELYFHYTFYLIMRLISCYTVYTEKQLSEGRADCIIETDNHVYIFEFKLDGTACEALQQIRERGYAKAYEADSRTVHLIGASFSSKTGTIDEWTVER